jgi:aryl-alcohol dehydrogenase-like predicted oxidoreductase
MSQEYELSRKEFLEALVASAGALAVPAVALGQVGAEGVAGLGPSGLPMRVLGRTGEELPVLGMGGSHLGRVSTEGEAMRMVEEALEGGVRFFDNAESYEGGKSERWMGKALREVREEVYLMSKTTARTREGAKRHLEGTLERLGFDSLDLWQFHSIRDVEDVDRGFAEGGVMEYLYEMREAGVIRHVGVTGHAKPEAHLRALHWFDEGMEFDTMQLPINPLDFHQHSFQKSVLPELVKREIGVIAMKTSAHGELVKRGICEIDECLRFVWALPVSLTVVGMDSLEHVRHNLALARESEEMAAEEMETLLARIESDQDISIEWYKKV